MLKSPFKNNLVPMCYTMHICSWINVIYAMHICSCINVISTFFQCWSYHSWFTVRIDWKFNVISMLIIASTFNVYFNIWHQSLIAVFSLTISQCWFNHVLLSGKCVTPWWSISEGLEGPAKARSSEGCSPWIGTQPFCADQVNQDI